MELEASKRLAILGHPHRLALFRLLMRRYPDQVPATEIAQALALKPSTFSTYIGALMQAGLVSQHRVGTSLRYAIRVDAVRETFDFLLNDCCRGRPDICSDWTISERARRNVVFVCTGNSARSIMAEAILRDIAGERFDVWSAGTQPRADLHPLARDVLRQNGHDVSALRAKGLADIQTADGAPEFDFVLTVCNQAANEDSQPWPGQPLCAHWGLPDPAQVEGSEAARRAAFGVTYTRLVARITAFAALPFAALDRAGLQTALDSIAQITEGAPA